MKKRLQLIGLEFRIMLTLRSIYPLWSADWTSLRCVIGQDPDKLVLYRTIRNKKTYRLENQKWNITNIKYKKVQTTRKAELLNEYWLIESTKLIKLYCMYLHILKFTFLLEKWLTIYHLVTIPITIQRLTSRFYSAQLFRQLSVSLSRATFENGTVCVSETQGWTGCARACCLGWWMSKLNIYFIHILSLRD